MTTRIPHVPHGQRVLLTVISGSLAFLVAEALHARSIARKSTTEGVGFSMTLPLVGAFKTTLKPSSSSGGSSGSGASFTLPKDAEDEHATMHTSSALWALAAAGAAFLVAAE